MSTKIGIISEGPIDQTLLDPLLSRIAQKKAGFTWPLNPSNAAEIFQLRKRGHGGVLEAVRSLVKALDTELYEHELFIILLDRRTKAVQKKVLRLIQGKERFVLGVAIEEIEAWWLGDRTNTLSWCGFSDSTLPECKYAKPNYSAERDRNPKNTLSELTEISDRFDRNYGKGSVDIASEFAEEFWRKFANLSEIESQCPRGFRPFEQKTTNAFRCIKQKLANS